MTPRILFINPNVEDYLADGLFHGLRTLLGADVVDFPKAEYMYETAPPAVLKAVRGGYGFSLYGLLPDLKVDRHQILNRALAQEFDLVIFGDIWRTFGVWTEWGPQLSACGIQMAVLDGADGQAPFPFGRLWWRRPGWWFLPRAHPRARYFKREFTPRTRRLASYLLLPEKLGRTLGIRPISFCIPAEKIVTRPPEKTKEFPTHIVDQEVAARVGGDPRHGAVHEPELKYAFATETEYYDDLKTSRFGITTKRGGWDTLRHYEIAACGAVPCFRNLVQKPETCAPHGLDRSNCLTYENADDLFEQVNDLDDRDYRDLQAEALSWVRMNTTTNRAARFLQTCGLSIPRQEEERDARADR